MLEEVFSQGYCGGSGIDTNIPTYESNRAIERVLGDEFLVLFKIVECRTSEIMPAIAGLSTCFCLCSVNGCSQLFFIGVKRLCLALKALFMIVTCNTYLLFTG